MHPYGIQSVEDCCTSFRAESKVNEHETKSQLLIKSPSVLAIAWRCHALPYATEFFRCFRHSELFQHLLLIRVGVKYNEQKE